MGIRRLFIPSAILFLVLLLATLGRTLWLELRELSTAGTDNLQWTILQVDT